MPWRGRQLVASLSTSALSELGRSLLDSRPKPSVDEYLPCPTATTYASSFNRCSRIDVIPRGSILIQSLDTSLLSLATMHLHSILTLLSIASTVHAIPTIVRPSPLPSISSSTPNTLQIPGRSTQNLHPRAEGFNVVFYDSATCAYEGITHGGIQPPTYGIEISGCQKYDPGTASFQALKPAVALKK